MHIIIIDDEKILSAGIQKRLLQEQYRATVIHSYGEYVKSHLKNVDLYIIDISLGDGNGFDIINTLKKDSKSRHIPILVMSGHSDISTKVEGLDIGADDYIVKPFDPQELLARIRSLLRRKDTPISVRYTQYKNYVYDYGKKEISQDESVISLTKKERQILEMFLAHKNTLIKKEEIIEKLWGKNTDGVTENTVNVTICNLRKKLGEDFDLQTRIGEGYILSES